ncbi:hypothetical protein [Mycobacterium tuberculosis]|nr:hypothetical protein [Mycobacterium tuberculosis]
MPGRSLFSKAIGRSVELVTPWTERAASSAASASTAEHETELLDRSQDP